MSDPIYVTKPFLPPFKEFVKEAARIWDTNILTNNGPLHQELEQKLAEYLGVPYVVLFNNGTIALQTAMQCLRLSGEVITTPYSFVATAHSIMWNGLRPVFVDVDAISCNLDWRLIEKSITPETSAIVAVHTYGFPCDTDKIQQIADAYNLKVIYDAAHAFGVQHEGRSLLLDGDLSVLSLHATKVFNTFEGGAVICKDVSTRNRLNFLKNFGFIDETRIAAVGTNGKMSEVNAALGLVQLRYIDECLAARKVVTHLYDDLLATSACSLLIEARPDVHNFAYYPVLIDGSEHLRDEVFNALRADGIYCRRYFYPLLSSLPIYRSLASSMYPVAESIANRVLCLPIYPDLAHHDVVRISHCLLRALGGLKPV
jgi:dTDP-4-amino-4,6-dideoxygalactose transaminase